MSAHQHWVAQRERLREALRNTGDAFATAHVTRHAIAQIEQNTMAEQTDDLLRQQTGILFSCVKQSLNLLDIAIATKVWVAQTQASKTKGGKGGLFLALSVLLQLLAGLYGYAMGFLLFWIPLAASIVFTLLGFYMQHRSRKQISLAEDNLRVTAKPDVDKLFTAIDVQMKAIDRYINDFSYLNDQHTLSQNTPEQRHAVLIAELMQAVYECDGEPGEEAAAATERLLMAMGIRAFPYTPENARQFTVLPSLGQTRTLVPALLSEKDGVLLARGTAAVLMQSEVAADTAAHRALTAQPPQEETT